MAGWPLLLVILPLQLWAQTPPAEPAPAAAIAIGVPKDEPVFPKLEWSGDIRVRAQSEKKGDDEARLSPRLRVRFGVGASIQKDLRAEIRLAAAKSNRSTNQTLGDNTEPGSRRRFIGLDLAYVKYYPVSFGTAYVGRFPQIHHAPGGSEVILDDDLALEGVGLSSEYEFIPKFVVFGAAGSTLIRENYDNYYSEDLSDNMINFGQLGFKWKGERAQAAIGGGFFNFTSVQGRNYADLAVGGKANGNSVQGAGVVAYPFIPMQYFAEIKIPLGSLDTKLFYEFVKNDEAPVDNKAFWAGIEVGQKKWDLNVAYTEVEADAVLALFTASDIGDGVTDLRGWVGKARWKFARNMYTRLTQMVNRTDMTGLNKEYRRTQLDLGASF